MNLEERLKKKIEEITSSIERVKKTVEREIYYPGNNMRIYLKTLDDFVLYLELHPEWKGKSSYDMRHNLGKYARSFHAAFEKFKVKTFPDKKERKRIKSQLFSKKPYVSKKDSKTIDDWINEYEKHPEWHNKSVKKVGEDYKEGGSKFYYAFIRWVWKKTKNKIKRRKLIAKVFGINYRFCYSYETIEEWENEYNAHPKWKGRSVKEMKADEKSGAALFFRYFKKWVNQNIKNKREINKLMGQFFKMDRIYRSDYDIQDWIDEYNEHPEWKNLCAREMDEGKIPKTRGFYRSFQKWVRKNTNNEEERIKLTQQIFSTDYKTRNSMQLENSSGCEIS